MQGQWNNDQMTSTDWRLISVCNNLLATYFAVTVEGSNQNKDISSSQFKIADFFWSAIANPNNKAVLLVPMKMPDSKLTEIVTKRPVIDNFDNNTEELLNEVLF